jgi:aryl-alcohol dehydrogenase-like predicted oxidoreductase
MIPKYPFGRTGHASSRILLGGAAFGEISQAEADRAIEAALAFGVNHVDTAASYGNAEQRLGDWLRRNGRTFFIATKTGERTAAGARQEIKRSLERLQVDRVDLIQLHNLVDPAEWETALGPGGALEAAIDARRQGLVRFIGITGHGWTAPAMHLKALERFDFDSVLLPANYLMFKDPHYRADFVVLLRLCRERNVAVQTIKSLVRSPWDDLPHNYATWYRPLEEQTDIDLAVHWLLAQDGLFLNTAGDIHLLTRILHAAEFYHGGPHDEQMDEMVVRLEMRPLFE